MRPESRVLVVLAIIISGTGGLGAGVKVGLGDGEAIVDVEVIAGDVGVVEATGVEVVGTGVELGVVVEEQAAKAIANTRIKTIDTAVIIGRSVKRFPEAFPGFKCFLKGNGLIQASY